MKTHRNELTWVKSSYSTTDENCVELAFPGPDVLVRDSKAPEGGTLHLSTAALYALLHSL
ncbi:DUF397 domain-containing protein [Amycolatopsis sp. NPDC059027]|uniref:DUF397 domain-containing protein n=1 Tax=Amycolatopsis sp. NPDC059027 TaxID=3346709 RepID=UPI00366A5F23